MFLTLHNLSSPTGVQELDTSIKLCVLIAFSRLISSITKPDFRDCCLDLKMHISLEMIVKICPHLEPGEQNFNLE